MLTFPMFFDDFMKDLISLNRYLSDNMQNNKEDYLQTLIFIILLKSNHSLRKWNINTFCF